MGVDPEQMLELMQRGWRCLNCGEHVPDSWKGSPDWFENPHKLDKIVFEGICTSHVCKDLPPGGNPFFVVIE